MIKIFIGGGEGVAVMDAWSGVVGGGGHYGISPKAS